MSKDWRHGTCGCTDDMGTCKLYIFYWVSLILLLAGCFGLWCGCCQIYNMAEDLGESGCLYLALTLFITPCVPIWLLRGKVREQYDIQGECYIVIIRKRNTYHHVTCDFTGDSTNDALMSCCCGFCVQVQTAQEIKENKQWDNDSKQEYLVSLYPIVNRFDIQRYIHFTYTFDWNTL